MSGSPEQPNRDHVNYRVSDPAALQEAVERKKEQARERAARAAEQQQRKPAAVEPETEQARRKRTERAIDATARLRKAEEYYEQNRETLETGLQFFNESYARSLSDSGRKQPICWKIAADW